VKWFVSVITLQEYIYRNIKQVHQQLILYSNDSLALLICVKKTSWQQLLL